MATLNWPGFGIASISWTLDQPAQVNRSVYTGVRAVAANPWHGKWSAKVSLATRQGDGAFQAARGFFTSLKGSINTFHLPAVEAAQNGNTGVTINSTTGQGQNATTLTGLTTALVAGNMVTVNGQLLSITSVSGLSAGVQVINFQPALRAAATAGTSVETAKPYALVYLSDSSFTWDIGQWRRYGLTFDVSEAVGETDGADPTLDVWTGGVGSGGGGGGGTSYSFPQLPSFTTRSLLAGVSSPTDKQVAYLTEAGREGTFVFSSANLSAKVSVDTRQGIYVAPSSDTTGASGAWVRKYNGSISVAWFGVAANDSTDDSPAFTAAIALANALSISGYGFGKGDPRLFIPAGKYYLGSTTLDLTYSMIIEGETCGGPSGGGSVLRWADNTTGIRTQTYDTTGATGGSVATTYPGAQMATIQNLSLIGGFTATESESHGIHLRCKAVLRDLYIDSFGGDGIHEWVYNTSPTYNGNANDSLIENVFIFRCRDGISLYAPDTNATLIIQPNCNTNRRWGFKMDNLIGANIVGGDMSSNGQSGISGFATMCTYAGKYYYCLAGHGSEGDNWCSTNPPSGTTADNLGWKYFGTGSAASTRPAWVSGMSIRAGGVGRVVGLSFCTVVGLYSESDQGAPQFDQNASVWISPLAAPPVNTDGTLYGGCINGNNSGPLFPTGFNCGSDYVGNDLGRGKLGLLQHPNEIWRLVPTGGGSGGYSAIDNSGNLIFHDGGSGSQVYVNLPNARWGGLLDTDSGYKVAGTQVVGARQTGWTAATGTPSRGSFAAAAAGTASAAYTQSELQGALNRIAALEARLIALEADARTHGLIN